MAGPSCAPQTTEASETFLHQIDVLPVNMLVYKKRRPQYLNLINPRRLSEDIEWVGLVFMYIGPNICIPTNADLYIGINVGSVHNTTDL